MSQAQAILAGALVIALAIFATYGDTTAKAISNGPYQLMHHSNTGANAGVFRIDTLSGEVSYCYVVGTTGADIMCSRAVR